MSAWILGFDSVTRTIIIFEKYKSCWYEWIVSMVC